MKWLSTIKKPFASIGKHFFLGGGLGLGYNP